MTQTKPMPQEGHKAGADREDRTHKTPRKARPPAQWQ